MAEADRTAPPPGRGRGRRVALAAVLAAVWLLVTSLVLANRHQSFEYGWAIEVDRSGLDTRDLGGGVRLEDGRTVGLVSGTIAIFSATATACPHDHNAWTWLFGAASARAGHGDDQQSEISGPFVIDLTAQAAVEIATATADEDAYCSARLTFAGSNGADRLAGRAQPTINLEVEIMGPGQATERRTVTTTSPWGAKADLESLDLTNGLTAKIDLSAILRASATGDADHTLAAITLTAASSAQPSPS